MHALLVALALFAQTGVSVTREAVKTQVDLREALASSARTKLDGAAASISTVDVKAARDAAKNAFPDAELGAAELDVLASYVLTQLAEIIDVESKKLDEQKDALRAAMKAAGVKPKAGAKYALKLSGDYAKAPEPLPDDATPAAMQQRLEELVAMGDLNARQRTGARNAAASALKKGASLDVLKALK
jgi:hypothetical protein